MYETLSVVQALEQLCREDIGGPSFKDEHTLAVRQGRSVWGCVVRNTHSGKEQVCAL